MRRHDRRPTPGFYRPEHAAEWSFSADATALRRQADLWRQRHQLTAAGDDPRRKVLLIIDAQKDFCLPDGTLFVGGRSGTGAVGDADRLARWIYRHLDLVSEITCTLDSHVPFQIFTPEFWTDGEGEPLPANREITAEDITQGRVVPDSVAARANGLDPAWLKRQVLDYCQRLEATGRHKLFLWPSHCLLGSDGHSLAGVIEEAVLFHGFCRRARNPMIIKGLEPLTESYSVFAPEVLEAHDGQPLGHRRRLLLEDLVTAERVIVAGQASSHCVRASLEHLIAAAEDAKDGDPARIYLLEDCCSAVALRDPESDAFLFDFTDAADTAMEGLAARGLRRVESTQPIEDWPGF